VNALRRLEQGGFQFSLSAGGQITWRNTWRDDAPDEWLQPLMAELPSFGIRHSSFLQVQSPSAPERMFVTQ